jgi:hypothetical protein
VFFSEPYEGDLWRADSIYREVLPPLCGVARKLSKWVVVKLHPFESRRRRQRMIDRLLSAEDRSLVSVLDEPLSADILRKTWCAVTVESTVAFECAAAGVPSFLCGWLRHATAGYAPQYARFGVGKFLEDRDGLLRIPDLVHSALPSPEAVANLLSPMQPEKLQQLLASRSV